jgi:hypothetical protein
MRKAHDGRDVTEQSTVDDKRPGVLLLMLPSQAPKRMEGVVGDG